MHRPLSSVLLMGVLIAAAPLMAQQGAAAPAMRPNMPEGMLEISVTYDATQSSAVAGGNFWMQGGSVQLAGEFYRGLSAVADIAGMHAGNIDSTGVSLNLVTATFGPRYTWRPANKRYDFFGQVLAGEANGFDGLFPNPSGATYNANSMAVEAGGGMNVALSPRIALRAFEVNWVRTQLPNSTTNVENNVRVGAGIVFRFR